MLASPRFPIKATILEYLLQTKAFQITTKTMEKQCLKIEQEVGESQEHGRCIGVPLSHLGCHLVLFDPLVWDRHPSFISYNFSSGRPQCPLLLDLHCLNYWKLWVCKTLLPMSAQLSDRPWIGNTRPAARYCASNQCAPHMLLMVWWPIPNITGWNLYFRSL